MATRVKHAPMYSKPHTKQGPREPGPHGTTLKMIEFSRKHPTNRYDPARVPSTSEGEGA
jgi:hypothetical protein